MNNRTITYEETVPAPDPKPGIELGVIYEDPTSHRNDDYRWFIGITNPTTALVNLRTGHVYTYGTGVLLGNLRPANPGTLTISVP